MYTKTLILLIVFLISFSVITGCISERNPASQSATSSATSISNQVTQTATTTLPGNATPSLTSSSSPVSVMHGTWTTYPKLRSSVFCINGDDLWLSTFDCLIKWDMKKNIYQKYVLDSNEVITLDMDQYVYPKYALPKTLVETMIFDNQGNLWVGTYGDGIRCWDGHRWKNFPPLETVGGLRVDQAFKDRDGKLWFATENGISCFDGANWRIFTAKDGVKPYGGIYGITQDKAGNIWYSAGSAIVSTIGYYNAAGWSSVFISGVRGGIKVFAPDDQGYLLFLTERAIYRGSESSFPDNLEKMATPVELTARNVLDVFRDTRGNLWFATANGVTVHNGIDWKTYTYQDGLSSNVTYYITQDKYGNIWCGADGPRVNRFNPG